MGLETLASVRNSVRLRGDYPRSPKFDDPYVNKEIQAAHAELYELVADTHEGWWDVDAALACIAGQSYLALPSTCWRVQALDLISGVEAVPLRRVGLADRNRYGTSSDQPTAYRLSARGIEFLPPPNANYALKLYFTPKVTPLAETTQFDCLNNWDEFVIESALLRLDSRQERPIQERWTKLYDPENGLKTKIAKSAGERNEQEPKYIPLREGFGIDDWGL